MKSKKIPKSIKVIVALMLILVLGVSSAISASAAVDPPYRGSGIKAVDTYNGKNSNGIINGTIAYENNINKSANDSNIIVIGDSRTCQLLNLDYKAKKYKLSGYAAWGQTYSGGINNKTKKVISGLTADSYIKTKLIKPALSSSKPCHIWVFGTINETYGDKNATKLIAYVKELKQYCIDTNKNKKVTIHVIGTVGGTSNWSAANQNVSAYNKAIQNAFGTSAPDPLIGDANGDNQIDITDVTTIQRYLASINMASFNKTAADANRDGEVDITDATTIQRYLAEFNMSDCYVGKRLSEIGVSIVTGNYSSIVYGTAPYCKGDYYDTKKPVFGYTYTTSANAKKYTKDGNYGTYVEKIDKNNSNNLDDGLHYNIHTLEAIGYWVVNNSR